VLRIFEGQQGHVARQPFEADGLKAPSLTIDCRQIIAKLDGTACEPPDFASLNEGVQDSGALYQHARAFAQAVTSAEIGADGVDQLDGTLGGGRAPVQAVKGEQLHLAV
jgi:hypothetical protein